MRQLLVAAALAACAMSGSCWAAPPPAPEPATHSAEPTRVEARKELARRYFKAIHYSEMVSGLSDNMLKAVLDQIAKSNPDSTEKIRQAIIDATHEAGVTFIAKIDDEAVAVIADIFTEAELRSMVDFYEGPVGQSIMHKSSVLIPRMTELVVKKMPALQADIERRFCAKAGCSKVKLPVATPS